MDKFLQLQGRGGAERAHSTADKFKSREAFNNFVTETTALEFHSAAPAVAAAAADIDACALCVCGESKPGTRCLPGKWHQHKGPVRAIKQYQEVTTNLMPS